MPNCQKQQRDYSIEPTATLSETVSGDGKVAYLWIVNRNYANCPKFHGEYSIDPTANPVRDSVEQWQMSIFVDC